jgi:hypothetical protein
MKKLFVLLSSVLIGITSYSHNPIHIDEQVLRSFQVQFPNAQKVIWQESQEAFLVSFIEDGIRVRIVYLRNGALTHFLRYYFEENLPLDVRLSLKDKYPGKTIYGVTEENVVSNVQNQSKTIYYVKLEDENSWFTIKVQRNRKMRLIEKLNKEL